MENKEWSTGAWKKQTQKGEVINFTINNVKYSMWVNNYKKQDNHPDYKIVINDFKPKQQGEQAKPTAGKPSYGNKDFDDFLGNL
jgi:hypothetical protein